MKGKGLSSVTAIVTSRVIAIIGWSRVASRIEISTFSNSVWEKSLTMLDLVTAIVHTP